MSSGPSTMTGTRCTGDCGACRGTQTAGIIQEAGKSAIRFLWSAGSVERVQCTCAHKCLETEERGVVGLLHDVKLFSVEDGEGSMVPDGKDSAVPQNADTQHRNADLTAAPACMKSPWQSEFAVRAVRMLHDCFSEPFYATDMRQLSSPPGHKSGEKGSVFGLMFLPKRRRWQLLGVFLGLSALWVLTLYATWRYAVVAEQRVFVTTRIKMPASGRVKVLQISDVQIESMTQGCKDLTREESKWPCDARNTTAFVRRLIAEDTPDLVVFGGDNVVGHRGNEAAREILHEVTGPVADAGIPFVSILGNHDVESPTMSVSSMHLFLRRASSQQGAGAVVSGNGLVVVEDQGEPKLHLWLFDYMHQFCLLCYHGGYAWGPTGWSYQAFTGEQIAFFRSQSDPAVPALAFAHVPVPEYATMADTPARQQKSAMVGDRFDAICPAATDSLYTELAAKKVVAMSVGHDHTNDFCGQSSGGPFLCYSGGTRARAHTHTHTPPHVIAAVTSCHHPIIRASL